MCRNCVSEYSTSGGMVYYYDKWYTVGIKLSCRSVYDNWYHSNILPVPRPLRTTSDTMYI